MMWYEKPLVMSVGDICKEYREAKYPEKQIEILAQLNDTKTTRIAWLLDRAGMDVAANKLPRAPRTEDGIDLGELWGASAEAAEADAIRAGSPEPSAEKKPAEKKPAEKKPAEKKPAEKKPAEKKPADEITAELWAVYLSGVRFRALDEADVHGMLLLHDIAQRLNRGNE